MQGQNKYMVVLFFKFIYISIKLLSRCFWICGKTWEGTTCIKDPILFIQCVA